MNILNQLYKSSLSLFTDLYQITMAYGYWKHQITEQEAVFNLYFRNNPFSGGYAVSCGLQTCIEYLENFSFDDSDIDYLRTLTGNDGEKLFEEDFLTYLKELKFTCDIDAIPEGELVFPNEPMIRVRGPLLQCQLLETPLLNIVNFQTLIATKAARLKLATKGEPLLEFGMRRAQGIDGALTASRAAFIGGCDATSNVLAGKLFNIPVKGTHAHSWVMSFKNEKEAFTKYKEAMPNNCILLVDTYNTIQGVKNAIETGKELKADGHTLTGIRLDSGDLAYLSIEARKLLDAAGFEDTAIVASNDLDEHIISSLKNQQDAKVNVWGVGTRLATAYEQPALGGVYKISALKTDDDEWEYRIKVSEQNIKTSTPGILQVRRFYSNENEYIGDMIYDELSFDPDKEIIMVDPGDETRRKKINTSDHHKDLLQPVFKKGIKIYEVPSIQEIQDKVKGELSQIHNSIKRFSNPHVYPVGLEKSLYELKTKLVLKFRNY